MTQIVVKLLSVCDVFTSYSCKLVNKLRQTIGNSGERGAEQGRQLQGDAKLAATLGKFEEGFSRHCKLLLSALQALAASQARQHQLSSLVVALAAARC